MMKLRQDANSQKQAKISDADMQNAIDAMCQLNKIGQDIAQIDGVTALTDVTGFGLLGHLREISDAQRDILCDPQTSGGLLCVVKPESVAEFLEVTKNAGLSLEPIGKTTEKKDYYVEII